MSLRVSLEEDVIKGASQAFEVLESVKQSIGFRKILSDAPLADAEAVIPEIESNKLFDPPQKFYKTINWSEL